MKCQTSTTVTMLSRKQDPYNGHFLIFNSQNIRLFLKNPSLCYFYHTLGQRFRIKISNIIEALRLYLLQYYVLHYCLQHCSKLFEDQLILKFCLYTKEQPPVVQKLDNAIHQINHYPGDKCWQKQLFFPKQIF